MAVYQGSGKSLMASFRSHRSLAASLTGLGIGGLLSMPAVAGNIKAGGLGTVVSGPVGGCNTGRCDVTVGTISSDGRNLFHRFDQFQADGAITGVTVDARGASSVILGVIDPTGAFLN